MNKIIRIIMKYKIIALIICSILLIILMSLLFSEISKSIDVSKREKILKSDFLNFTTMFKEGKSFEANMMFEENSKNEKLINLNKAPEKSKMLGIGYVEYIQTTDYMLEYFKKFDIKISKIKQMDNEKAVIIVRAKRPDYLKHMAQCDSENVDNPNYNFNKAFIEKINSNKVEYITGDFEISLLKSAGSWKVMYSDQMKEMLYGKSAVVAQDASGVQE